MRVNRFVKLAAIVAIAACKSAPPAPTPRVEQPTASSTSTATEPESASMPTATEPETGSKPTAPDSPAVLFQKAVERDRVGDLLGARVLFESALREVLRTESADSRNVQRARITLGGVLNELGQHAQAEELIRTAVEVLVRTASSDDVDLQIGRVNWALAMNARGDIDGARRLQEEVLDVFTRTFPETDSRLQVARLNLAATRQKLGDVRGGLALSEQALEVLSRTLAADDPLLQIARSSVSQMLREIGDLDGARELAEAACAAYVGRFPEDHPKVLVALNTLASVLKEQGELARSRILFERILDQRMRSLGPNHRDVQIARMNLAVVLRTLGDLQAARELNQHAIEGLSRLVPEDDPSLINAQSNLAATLADLGRHPEALELFVRVSEIRSRTLPADDLSVLEARACVATERKQMGDLRGVREEEEALLAAFESNLPANALDVQRLRVNLGDTLTRLGDLRAALALYETAIERLTETLPNDHPDVLTARINLAACCAELGDVDRSRAVARSIVAAMRRALSETVIWSSPREAEERTLSGMPLLSGLISLAAGDGRTAVDAASIREVFLLEQQLRAVALSAADVTREARGDDRLRALRSRIRAASTELARCIRAEASSEIVSAARTSLESLQQELTQAVRAARGGDFDPLPAPDLDALERGLSSDSVLVSYRVYQPTPRPAKDSEVREPADALCAFILSPDHHLAWIDLGTVEPVRAAAAEWRAALGTSADTRGVGMSTHTATRTEREAGEALRRLVVDPLLPAIGPARHVWVALDDALHEVSLDALPSGAGWLGDTLDVSIRPWLRPPERPAGETSHARRWLGLGGVDYDAGSAFPPLAATRSEVEAIADLARASAPANQAESVLVLLEADATRDALERACQDAREIHIATHGWFASHRAASPGLPYITPLSFCGLALAGANRPPDELGNAPGILTGEEIATWSLDASLVVLSACQTNVGIERPGQGVASIQKAFHMAGADTVIASLWPVPDEATRELMVELYRRMWRENEPVDQALWHAKMMLHRAQDAAGRPRYATRDWAGWVVSHR